jgi:hypothetical protein
MGTRFKQHVGANVVGYVALVIAVAGVPTAWAIGKNTVRSKQIAPKAVKASDLATNAVKSPKVANGTLLAEDFAADELPAGATGPQGPQGLQGPAGSPDSGSDILGKLQGVDGDGSGLDADSVDGHSAECPSSPATFFHLGYCYDTLARGTTTWSAAHDICSSASGYLPDIAQLDAIRSEPFVNLGADAASATWSSNVSIDDDGTGINVLTKQDDGGISSNDSPTTTQQSYRCAYDLVR